MHAIFHISDIHLKTANDLALTYLPEIHCVLNDLSINQPSGVTVVISGDIAYSGKKTEYDEIYKSLIQLKESIKNTAKIDAKFLCVAGNHDCDFSSDDAVRKLIINSIPKETQKISDPDLIKQCVKVQDNYYEFSQKDLFLKPVQDGCQIYQKYQICDGDLTLVFRCYNTAWVSQLHEQPGQMSYPKLYLEDESESQSGDIVVSVLHHPTNWLTPNRRRLFDAHLDQTSDLILLGHEHLPEEFTKSDFKGNSVGYILGGAFQEKSNICEAHFNVILLNAVEQSYRLLKYQRKNGGSYEKIEKTDDWTPCLRASKMYRGAPRLNVAFYDWVNDLEIDFAHPSGKRLTLDDLFIMPDFKILDEGRDANKSNSPSLSADKFEEFFSNEKNLILHGSERAGKTTLVKWMLNNLLSSGITPVLLNGEELKPSAVSKLDKLIRKKYQKMFSDPDLPKLDNLSPEHRAVIIDNFGASKINADGRLKILERLREKFGKVIILGDPLMFIEEIAAGVSAEKGLKDFSRLQIREFGRFRRQKLIRRWYSIGANYTQSREEVENRVTTAERLIDTLLGRSFLPSNPVFVYGFLQTSESASNISQVGICGYHYESFVKNSLNRSSESIKLDYKFRFLSEFSFFLFSKNRKDVEEFEFEKIFNLYSDKYRARISFTNLVNELKQSRLIEFYDGAFSFRYSYAYYFFVARYFHDNLEDENIRSLVREMASKFHDEKTANIWLFLVHLSKSPFLLKCISEQAALIFSETTPCRLEEDVDVFRNLDSKISKFAVPETISDQHIEAHYDTLDKQESVLGGENESSVPASTFDAEEKTVFKNLDAMMKTIQVLGQLLKNFPGSLTSAEKTVIVQDSFELGLRGLAKFLGWLGDDESELVEYVAGKLSEQNGDLKIDEAVRKKIKKSIFWLVEMNVHGLVKLISRGVGAEGEEEIYRDVIDSLGSKSSRLIGVSIGLDTMKIPKNEIFNLNKEFQNDPLCLNVLRSLVAQHFYLFRGDTRLRDEICAKMEIKVLKPGSGLPLSSGEAKV